MQNDQPDLVSELPTLEGLLLWTMRAWVIGHCHGRNVGQAIHNVFTRLGAPEAAQALDDFMSTLGAGARRMLEVNCTCHPELTGDERSLLRALVFEQYEAPDDAYAMLATMVTEQAATAACSSAGRLVCSLVMAGHALRPTTFDEKRRFGNARRPVHGSARSHYLH